MELRDWIELGLGILMVGAFVLGWVQGLRESIKAPPPVRSLSHEEIQVERWRIIQSTYEQ